MRKPRFTWLRVVSLLMIVAFVIPMVAGCGSDNGGEKQSVIFADLGWDSAMVHSRIAAFILEHGFGYPASTYTPGETIPLTAGLAKGDVDVNMEIWYENQKEAVDGFVADGSIVKLGVNFDDDWQGFLVPTYMIDDGLLPADISVDNIGQYWELFTDPEDPNKGAFYSCIPGWECEKVNEAKFAAYGLDQNFNVILPGSGAALLATMKAAYEQHEPWFGYYWAPTPALGQLDMTPVAEPAFNQATWDADYACAYPAVSVDIYVNSAWKDKQPDDVIAFLSSYHTLTAQNNDFLGYMNQNNASHQDAAIYFLKNFEDTWTKWVSDDVAAKVKDALAAM
jgi:glycine betaine/proline transport system substrate-binding protein